MSLKFFLADPRAAIVAMLCVICGIWLGFPNDLADCPILVFLWPIALIWLGENAGNFKTAFLQGWLSTLAGSFCALYWLAMPVHEVGGLPWIPAILCALLIAAILSLQGGIISCACHHARESSTVFRVIFPALLWYILEYAFAVIAGFPWLPLAGALCVWPVMTQCADVIGVWGCGALWLFALLPATFAAFHPELFSARRKIGAMAFSICMIILILGYGVWRLESVPLNARPDGENVVYALFVEGNIDQNQKWDPVFQHQTLDLYLRLTADGMVAARSQGIEHPLIIWPETALPFFFESRPLMAAEVSACAARYGCPLLFGAPGLERDPDLPEGAVFNRAFLLSPTGSLIGHYDKMHLVPFGEYLPSWLKLEFLEALLQGVGIYQEGVNPEPLIYGRLALGMLICYEGIFPWLAQERVNAGANILVDISNDGWFGLTPACRQHLYLTALRCIEQNRWLLRSTNTGISAVIDSRGRVVMAGPQFQAGFLIARAEILQEVSIYHIISPWLPWSVILVLGMAWFVENKKLMANRR